MSDPKRLFSDQDPTFQAILDPIGPRYGAYPDPSQYLMLRTSQLKKFEIIFRSIT